MGVLFSYTGDAAITKRMVEEERKEIIINVLYKHSRGFYWKVNSRGYIHIIMPNRVTLNGKISHYEIQDQLLTKDNMLRVVNSYGNFKTVQECVKEIENDLWKVKR